MKKLNLREQAIMYSFFAFFYIVLVSFFMSNGEKLFSEQDGGILAPIGVLLVFVISAAVMGLLVFGKAILIYLDGNKKDAVKLVIYNISCLLIIAIIYFGVLVLIK